MPTVPHFRQQAPAVPAARNSSGVIRSVASPARAPRRQERPPVLPDLPEGTPPDDRIRAYMAALADADAGDEV